jgi:hypothetical protein
MSNSNATATKTTHENLWTVLEHIKICWPKYAIFVAAYLGLWFLAQRYPDSLPEISSNGKISSVSDLSQSMLSLCALTVPLVVAYILHPHESLFSHLASHLENMLGASGIYKDQLNNISTSVSGQSKELEPMAAACLWIIRHKYNLARGEALSNAGEGWLFNKSDLAPTNEMLRDKDKVSVAFYVLTIGLLIIFLFVGLFLGSYKDSDYIRPFLVSSSIMALSLNLFAYFNIFRYVVRRLNLKSQCIWKIDTQYELFERTMKAELELLEEAKKAATTIAKPPQAPRVRQL